MLYNNNKVLSHQVKSAAWIVQCHCALSKIRSLHRLLTNRSCFITSLSVRFGLSLPLFRGLLCYAVHFFSHSYLSMITLTINSNGSKKYSPLSNSINQFHIHTPHSTYFKKASYKTGFACCTYLETWTQKQAHLYSCVRL